MIFQVYLKVLQVIDVTSPEGVSHHLVMLPAHFTTIMSVNDTFGNKASHRPNSCILCAMGLGYDESADT